MADEQDESIRSEFENIWLSEEDVPEAAPDEGTPVLDEEAPQEAPEEDTAPEDDRPRNEKGQFISQREQEERLLAGKYRTPEELEAAYSELASAYGRQGNEMGELRKAVESLQESMPQQQAYQPSYDWDNLIDVNPAMAAQAAYESGDQFQLNRAVQAWEDVAPGAPSLWAQVEAMKAQIAEMQESVPQQIQPLIEQQATQQTQQILGEFYRQHPGAEKYSQQMSDRVMSDPLGPRLIQVLENGTPQEKVGVLTYLFNQVRATDPQQADTLQAQAKDIAVEQARLAEQAKLEAQVVSASNSNAGDPPPQDPADAMWEAWAGFDISRLKDSP